MKNTLILFVLSAFAYSCKTYEKVDYLDSWRDKWNVKYQIICTKTYLRKNDSLVKIKVDTLKRDPNTLNENDIFTK
jgi:hypothetical protein